MDFFLKLEKGFSSVWGTVDYILVIVPNIAPFCTLLQWCSKAVRGPGSTEVLRVGLGLWGRPATGLARERYKLPQWGPPATKGFDAFHIFSWPFLLLKTLRVCMYV